MVDEVLRDHQHHQRTQPPTAQRRPAAGGVKVSVKGDTLMLDLFDRVPAPHRGHRLLAPGKVRGVCQQFVCEQGGVMFQRHRGGDIDDRRALAGQR